MKKSIVLAFIFALAVSANAGVIRHAAKSTAHVTKKVVVKTAHGAKKVGKKVF